MYILAYRIHPSEKYLTLAIKPNAPINVMPDPREGGQTQGHLMFSIFLCQYIVPTMGPITWSIFNPGVELSPVNRVEIFCDYMDDFNPGVETLYYTFSASIRGSKKTLYFVFL